MIDTPEAPRKTPCERLANCLSLDAPADAGDPSRALVNAEVTGQATGAQRCLAVWSDLLTLVSSRAAIQIWAGCRLLPATASAVAVWPDSAGSFAAQHGMDRWPQAGWGW
jgi:hypothetical protein